MRKLLVTMFVALLMAGCGESTKKPAGDSPESNQSSAATPEAKTAEVGGIDLDNNETRNRIIAEAIDDDELDWRGNEGEELGYAFNQQNPYSGWVKRWRGNEDIEWLFQLKDGKHHGLSTGWYPNGRSNGEETYKDGKLVTAVAWKPNGEKCPATNVKGGNGVWVLYNEDGTESERNTYKDGKHDGPFTAWYPNGQKWRERNYKDGKLWTAVQWKPNGEKCPVTNVVDGNGVEVFYNDDGTEYDRYTYKDGEQVLE